MNRQNLKKISEMKSIIEKRGMIHEFDLIDEMNMLVPTFNVWKTYLMRHLDGFIEYDKTNKTYRWMS